MMLDDATRWFEAIFAGDWMKVPSEMALPDWIIEDSRQWSDLFLNRSYDPYRQTQEKKRELYLGKGNSPDKMVTCLEDEKVICVIETLQHFVVTKSVDALSVETAGAAMEVVKQSLLPLLSEAVRTIVLATMDEVMSVEREAALAPDQPTMLATSDRTIAGVSSWQDKVNIIWYERQPYVDFYKTYPEFATAIFRPGNDWFPKNWRAQLGVQR